MTSNIDVIRAWTHGRPGDAKNQSDKSERSHQNVQS